MAKRTNRQDTTLVNNRRTRRDIAALHLLLRSLDSRVQKLEASERMSMDLRRAYRSVYDKHQLGR